MSNRANVYVGVTKSRVGNIAWETVRPSVAEVWDAIFYNIEKGNAQYPREKAPQMLGHKWQVMGIGVDFPPNITVSADNFSICGLV